MILDTGGSASATRRLLTVTRLRRLNLLLAVAIGLGAAPGLVSTPVTTIMDALARHHVVILLLNMLFRVVEASVVGIVVKLLLLLVLMGLGVAVLL